MRKTLFEAAPPSVSSPGKSVSASTHAGASCVFELRDIVCRRSSHALDGTDSLLEGASAIVSASFAVVPGAAIKGGGVGRSSGKATCALTRQTPAKKIANAARVNIKCARLIHTRAVMQALSLMRPHLQAMRHFENRRQNAEHNQTYESRDNYDNHRGNQLRNYPDRAIKLALVHICDRLHRFSEMSGLFAHAHHVRKQIRKEFLLLQRRRKRC